MNTSLAREVLDTIKEFDRIIIFRHFRPDGDAVGSTRGLQRILQLSFPEKEIVLQNCDFSDYMSFFGEEEALRDDEFYADALGIVVDTATTARISNQKFSLCKRLIKIDHHIPKENYGDICFVEEERSSACEIIANFYATFKDELKINKEAATYIYAGMVTDSGRFRYDSTTGKTHRLAAALLDVGFSTADIYRGLYSDNFDNVRLRARFVLKIKFTDAGVAYIYTTKEEVNELGVDTFTISRGMVGTMSEIKGVDIWANFTETEEGILCELRSSLYNINTVAVKYGGGGHEKASGATLKDYSEVEKMLADLDRIIKENK
jgi:phosphoesterase RecJ-like protein